MKCLLTATRAVVAMGLMLAWPAAGRAGTVVLDFESVANAGNGFYDVGRVYQEDGYSLAVFVTDTNGFVTFGAGETRYGGSSALYNNNGNGGTTLTRTGGGTFSLTSIDLAGDTRFGTIPVSFTGTRADASTVTRSFTLSNGLLQTFSFGGAFTDVVKVEWLQVTPYHQFDNIVVEHADEPNPVPEEGPGLSMLISLAVACGARRFRGGTDRAS